MGVGHCRAHLGLDTEEASSLWVQLAPWEEAQKHTPTGPWLWRPAGQAPEAEESGMPLLSPVCGGVC